VQESFALDQDGFPLRRSYPALGLLTALALTVSGCATVRPAEPPPVPGPGGIVFVTDGAGNFQAASRSLRKVLAKEHSPLNVFTYPWSHGFLCILPDQLDGTHARAEGQKLAGVISDFQQNYPDAPVSLVGHSAGCLVALTAAECLPPGSLERVVLLAPSVSADYDLRPALRAVRANVEVFYSTSDFLYLGLWVRILGTVDRRWTPAGGLVGFRPHVETFEDAVLYSKLRQHSWLPKDRLTGNQGGHYGAYQPGYLRSRVVPLLHQPSSAVWVPAGAP
jgi:pimeloyl-ACP methyl ester carboxylesterase